VVAEAGAEDDMGIFIVRCIEAAMGIPFIYWLVILGVCVAAGVAYAVR
jgi:hypothetical protein